MGTSPIFFQLFFKMETIFSHHGCIFASKDDPSKVPDLKFALRGTIFFFNGQVLSAIGLRVDSIEKGGNNKMAELL